MYGRSFCSSFGLHEELLVDDRDDRSDDERDECPQTYRDDRQDPPATPDVPDEQRRRDDRDHHQQVQRGKLRRDVGLARSLDDPARREVQLEPCVVVLRGLHQRHQRQDHREVRLHLRGHPLERALQADAAVQVVRDRGDDQDDDERRRTASRTGTSGTAAGTRRSRRPCGTAGRRPRRTCAWVKRIHCCH